jgi:hypothetical protein
MGGLAPSIPHEAVRIATGFDASIRCAREAAANPPNTTAWIAPSREIASIPIRAAGIIGTVKSSEYHYLAGVGNSLYIKTTSPLFTPSSLSTPAKVSTSFKSCLYVYFSLVFVTGLSKIIAV